MASKQVLVTVFVFAATFNSLALWPAAACTAPKTPIGPIAEYAGDGHSSRFTAFYDGATRRYRHAVLGDSIEGSVLTVITPRTRDRCGLRVKLDLAHVFEDISPRLVDLDGDKQPEVITVRSHRDKGAQLAVYKIAAGKLEMVASTPYIGRAHRWLAPIGAADLDGDGNIEIAYIDRPHLAKELRIWRYRNGKLKPVSKASGLTNHRIGEDFITGGVRTCEARPELITVDGGWSRIMATTLDRDGRINTRSIGRFVGQRSMVAALACKAG
ncbi:MAG: FG-GAP repeat domain-containing protein [Hyphomicrobiaceae bacterium]